MNQNKKRPLLKEVLVSGLYVSTGLICLLVVPLVPGFLPFWNGHSMAPSLEMAEILYFGEFLSVTQNQYWLLASVLITMFMGLVYLYDTYESPEKTQLT